MKKRTKRKTKRKMAERKRYKVRQGCTIKKDGKTYPHPATILLTDKEAMTVFWRSIEFPDSGQCRAIEDKVNEEYRSNRRNNMLQRNKYLSEKDVDDYLGRR